MKGKKPLISFQFFYIIFRQNHPETAGAEKDIIDVDFPAIMMLVNRTEFLHDIKSIQLDQRRIR